MNTPKEKKTRKQGKRSPGYPMISLEEAIQKAKILWEKDKNNPIPLKAAYEHLGYKAGSTYGARVLAAMKKFGLIYEKQNDIILTDEAIDLALHEAYDETYTKTTKKLALKPTSYEKLFNEYGGNLPSDATLKIKLIKDYDFNPDKVDGFLADFRKTIEFANLSGDKELKEVPQDQSYLTDMSGSSSKPRAGTQMQKMQTSTDIEREIANYPVGRGLKARILISGGSPVTTDSIEKLIKLLELNRDDLPETVDDEKDE
ncbi:MAG: hypothetical protein AB1401_15165 [Thermodesulfobacteriota bacterium]